MWCEKSEDGEREWGVKRVRIVEGREGCGECVFGERRWCGCGYVYSIHDVLSMVMQHTRAYACICICVFKTCINLSSW